MLDHLDLFKIRLISELARAGSLAGAAKELRITSSAVSQNVRKLERVLGKPLFLRIGKGVKPTPLAVELARRAQPFFADLAELLGGEGQGAEVRIGAPPIFGVTGLMRQLEAVRRSLPEVRICLTLADTKKLTEELLEGKVDFVFMDVSPQMRDSREIVTRAVVSEALVLACSADFYKLHLKKDQSLKILKALPHVPYHGGQEGTYKWYHHHYGRVPELPWTFAVDHAYGVRHAVLQGWGLGVLPRSLVEQAGGRLIVVPGPKSELKSQILLAQNKARVPPQAEKAVLGLLFAGPVSGNQ